MQDRAPHQGLDEGRANLLREERQDTIAILTLTRPDARNSLSLEMIGALQAAVDRLSTDRTVSAVVLAATGPAFCAGHDLKELAAHRTDDDRGRAFYRLTMDRCAALMTSILRAPKPFIAAVEGVATAAGT